MNLLRNMPFSLVGGRDGPRPVLRRLMVPLSALLFAVVLGAWLLAWRHHVAEERMFLSNLHDDVAAELMVDVDHQAAGLEETLLAIDSHPSLSSALVRADPDELLRDWSPAFEALRSEHGIQHFYFFDSNRICILRMHRPERNGDRIDRFTAAEAERQGRTVSGLELGPLGVLMLRSVRPIHRDGVLVGFVELGKGIEDVLRLRHQRSGSHVTLAICKSALTRSAWEEEMRRRNRAPEWDRFKNSVIAFSTLDRVPAEIEPLLYDCVVPAPQEHPHVVEASDRKWRTATIPVHDAANQQLGCLLVMADVTDRHGVFLRRMAAGAAVAAALMVGLLGFVAVLLSHTDSGIRAQRSALLASG